MKATVGVGVFVSMLVVMGTIAPRASADLIGGQFLGGSLGQTDIWTLTCGLGTASARASVTDTGGVDTRRINVCVTSASGVPGQCRSTDGGSSGEAAAFSGPGTYVVTINEAGPSTAPEPYTLFITCRNSSNAITPHFHLQLQNQ